MYGRGAHSIAEQIGGTDEEANGIINSFYEGFPAVKQWMDKTYESVRECGYVEDFWGRRRRLPDILKKPYEISVASDKNKVDFNPLLGSLGIIQKTKNPLIAKYEKLLAECRYNSQKEKVKQQAKAEGVTIIDNGAFIAQAERQCVNARVQGSSASLTKLAMIKIANDPLMKQWDAHLIIGVHDELLVEGKAEYAEEIAKQLSYDMISAASDNGVEIPMKCDADVFIWWYQDQIIGDMKKALDKMVENGKTTEEALDKLEEDYKFLTEEQRKELFSKLIEE